MRHQTNRTQPLTDLDIALQRRGQDRELSVERRELAAQGLEVLGFDIVAHRLRDLNRCLSRADLQVAPAPAPRPGPRPRATAPTPPILRVLEGGGEQLTPALEDHLVLAELRVILAALAARRITPELRDDLAAAIADLSSQDETPHPRGA